MFGGCSLWHSRNWARPAVAKPCWFFVGQQEAGMLREAASGAENVGLLPKGSGVDLRIRRRARRR